MIMNFRIKFSIFLLATGLLLLIIPVSGNRSLTGRPEELINIITGEKGRITADQVARMIVNEDSLLNLIDVRSPDEYNQLSIPGAINVPYPALLESDPSTLLGEGNIINVFYSNDDYDAGFAMALAAGMGYSNCKVLQGGLNEWFRTILNNNIFTGEKISARENALYETRTRAGRLFTEMNSLPDSLKARFLSDRRFDPKKLDGGCE